MSPDQILRDFARDDLFPKAAMAAARMDRETLAPIFVDLVRRLGVQRIGEMDDADTMALLPVFHLLGEWREPTAHRPLVNLLRRSADVLDYLLGDAITETSYRVLAGTFGGDLELLFAAVDDRKADEFARSACMHALVLIAQTHPEHRDAIVGFFRSFLTRCPTSPQIVLTGWMDAIADLGLEDMSGQVQALFQDGRIPPEYCTFEHFLEDLREALDPARAAVRRRYLKGLITDAIDELSKWHCYTDAFFAEQKRQKVSNQFRVAPWTQSFTQPKPKIGRNEPCPCGSAKKYKKCCLH
jgi:Protein of unknown function (DUF1186)/SEC-C motif